MVSPIALLLTFSVSWSAVSGERYKLVGHPKCIEFNTGGFTHPGIFHSCADLERMQEKVWAGEEPWTTGFGRMFNESLVGLGIASVNAYNIRGPLPELPYGQDAWSSNFTVDAQYAYLNSVAYFVTGHPFHRERALHTARRWLTTLHLLEEYIRGGNGLRYLTAACEIVRSTTTSGWTANDTALYHSFAQKVRSNWDSTNGMTRPDLFFNQGGYANGGALSMAVFIGDLDMYNTIILQATEGANPDPTIDYALQLQISNDTEYYGQITEMGRDQGHPGGSLNILNSMAYTAEIQGDVGGRTKYVNMFEYGDYRLLAGLEYYAKYNLGHDVSYEAKLIGWDSDPKTGYYTKVASTDRGIIFRTQQHPTDIGALNAPTSAYYRYKEIAPDRIKYLKTYVEGQTPGLDTLAFARKGNFEDLTYTIDNGYGGSFYDVIQGTASKRASEVNETVEGRSRNTTAPDIAVLQGNSTISFPAFWKVLSVPVIRIEAQSPNGADLEIGNGTAVIARYRVPASSTFSTKFVNTSLPAGSGNQFLFLTSSADVSIARFNMTGSEESQTSFEQEEP